jgi:tetratricopeptide (TPR) repeat protein
MFRRSRRGRPAGGESHGQSHDADEMNALGVMLTDEGRLDEAEYLLRRAVAAGDVNALNNLGNILEARGDKPGAVMYWRQAAERGLSPAMCSLAKYLATTGQFAEADSWYRRARDSASRDLGLDGQNQAAGTRRSSFRVTGGMSVTRKDANWTVRASPPPPKVMGFLLLHCEGVQPVQRKTGISCHTWSIYQHNPRSADIRGV